MNEDEYADYEASLDALAGEVEDDYYGPTDEFFYADEWDLETVEDFIEFDAHPFEDDCYAEGF